ncbi:TetR/AcrR family transcriptional regulator [Yinghuangia seranimata]|uniref:TetR/AcrR family transcriptional regulator n=1 Tax=Yinghuangia seranimata TaxID=408067 RepID=UPI00248CCE75|nr:TetR/AcrR family transcriptional regulator C-terminal domain-containing protein [Yinghuangia seranimata]MDI2126018.1 TetR/AcrR family transcriptional regulator C-terminal domain-containing protein [Yinghuangia seranimata]
MGRPTNPLLSRDAIAAAALDLTAEEGADALTIRAIAARLGVRGPSLYNHVSSKDDLLDAMSALISRELDSSALESADWRAGLTAYARSYRRVFLRHHGILPVIARRPVQTAEALSGYDALARALLRLGCKPAEAAELSAALDYLVIGSVLETYTAGFSRPPNAYRTDFPALAETLGASATTTPGGLPGLDERGFERGLALLLDGLELRLTRTSA